MVNASPFADLPRACFFFFLKTLIENLNRSYHCDDHILIQNFDHLIGHLHDGAILLLRPESFKVSPCFLVPVKAFVI